MRNAATVLSASASWPLHRIGEAKHDLVRHGSDSGIADGHVLKGLVRLEGLLDFLDRVERRGFSLQMDAGPVDRQFPYFQRHARRHMFHQIRKAGKNVVASAVDNREIFFQLRHPVTRLVQFLTRTGARTECLLVLRLEAALELLDRRIFEEDACREIS